MGIAILADRRLLQRLDAARELLAEGKFPEALPVLQQILEMPGDSFFIPDPANKTVSRSLKTEVRGLLSQLTPDGRRAYELQFGATARSLLTEAVDSGETAALGEVARRYLHTEAGLEAQYRLAVWHANHGEPLAAVLGFEQVQAVAGAENRREPLLSIQLALAWRRFGDEAKAVDVLKALAARPNQAATIAVGGRELPFPRGVEQAAAWLKTAFPPGDKATAGLAGDWLMPGGSAGRNPARVSEAARFEVAWPKEGISTVFDPLKPPDDVSVTEIDRQLRVLVRQAERPHGDGSHFPSFPGEGVVVGDTIVVRTPGNLHAIDARDGSRRWETLVDESFELCVPRDGETAGTAASAAMAALVLQRLTRDATYGQLSSDGRRIFAVEDLGHAAAVALPQGGTATPRPSSRLAAYDLRTGKLEWEVGGAAGPFELDLAGTFFLGPPLPLSGRLYALAEVDREIRVLVLDAKDGGMEWMQPVLAVDTPIGQDATRRMASPGPAYGDGVLVCPTAAGFVVAIDVTARSLRWLVRVPVELGPVQPIRPFRRPIPVPNPNPEESGREPWQSARVLIDGGKALISVDAPKSLICLSLSDGKELWKKTTFDSEPIAVAGVWKGQVLLAAADGVSAVSLADGTAAWNRPTRYPEQHLLSGRGLIVDGRVYVPLRVVSAGKTGGAVAMIDAVTGRLLATRRLVEDRSMGNLGAMPGYLVSQGLSTLDVFPMPAVDREEMAVGGGMSGRR